MSGATSRVEQLACPPPAEPQLLQGRAWLATAGEPWTVIRRGRVTAAILGGLTPVIDDGELLTAFKSAAEPAMAPVLGQRAHMAIDIEKLLRLGIHEAVQAVHFVNFWLCAGQRMLMFQFGRPDRYLLPFYRRDLAAGRLTPADALELIDCLGIMLSEYTPRGLAVGWMLGGGDAAGVDVCNELTALFLDSVERVRLSHPAVGLCWTPDIPRPIMAQISGLLAAGLTHPVFFNDDLISAGLMEAALPPAEACLYQHSTCVEITPIASSNVYVASPYVNLVQLLHDTLGLPPAVPATTPAAEPVAAAAGRRPETFEALLAGYRRRLAAAVRQAAIEQNTIQATRRYNGGLPRLSCFVNDCLARGCDIDRGGARYNGIEPSFVGLSNLVDSLAAMRKFVYDEGVLGLDELVQALASDFAGREDLRHMLLNRSPKYGNDDDSVDDLAVQVTGWIRDRVGPHAAPRRHCGQPQVQPAARRRRLCVVAGRPGRDLLAARRL
jgi:pyruvate-formate lyase